MKSRRKERLNSLLKEVISEVIQKDVKNPSIHSFISVTDVDISSDLHQAKVYVSIIGTEKEKKEALNALKEASSFIAFKASKKVVLRYFPSLFFYLDKSVEDHLKIEKKLDEIKKEQESRKKSQ